MYINILGTKYSYNFSNILKDEILDENTGGYCDPYDKKIVINQSIKEAQQGALKHVIRHELIHAMLFESGGREFSDNEILVDLLATQIPKMIELFKKTNSL